MIITVIVAQAMQLAVASPVTVLGGGAERDLRVQLLEPIADTGSASELFESWNSLHGPIRDAGISEGFSRRPIWLRATLAYSEAARSQWWLTLSNPSFDRVEVYLRGPDGQIRSMAGGEDLPQALAAAPTLTPSFPLSLSKGEHWLLVRIETRNALAARIALRSEESMLFFEQREMFHSGLIAGAHLIALMAGFAIAWMLRERLWLLYAQFVFVNGFLLLFTQGVPSWWVLRSMPGMSDKLLGVLLILVVPTVLAFVGQLTRTQEDYPQIYRWAIRIAWGFVVPGGALILAGYFTETILKLQFILLAVVPTLLVLLWRQSRRGDEAARYYLIGIGAFALVSGFRVLRNLGVLPSAWWTEGLQELASIGYLSVLAFGIATASSRARAQRDTVQAQLSAELDARAAERDFLAMLSHELRTPLATIEASTRLLRDMPGLDVAAREIRYAKIEKAMTRLRDLFDRLLASDRVRTDWQLSDVASLDLVSLLMLARDAALIERNDAEIQLDSTVNQAVVRGDRNLLLMAIGNLLSNALAYGPEGAPIRLEIQPDARGWRMAVVDLGEPIPVGERDVLFSPYLRGSRAAATPGAGLGLFIVRRIARVHGGDAGFEVPEGGGNRFWIQIPVESGQ